MRVGGRSSGSREYTALSALSADASIGIRAGGLGGHRTVSEGQSGIRAAFKQVEGDIRDIIQSIARYAAMNISLDKLMRNREEFKATIQKQIDVDLEEWGLGLKTLEILHIKDHSDEQFHVIEDNEKMIAQQIETKSRKAVATQKQAAEIAESDADKATRLQIAENEENASKREIEKNLNIALAQQEQEMKTQEATQKANLQKVEAERAYAVGKADYEAEANVKTAEGAATAAIAKANGEKQAKELEGLGLANYTRDTKTADADGEQAVLLAKAEGKKADLLAEAEGTSELADAKAKLQEAAMAPLALEAITKIQIGIAEAYAKALAQAKPTIISSSMVDLLGQDFDIGSLTQSMATIIETAKALGVNIPGVETEENAEPTN